MSASSIEREVDEMLADLYGSTPPPFERTPATLAHLHGVLTAGQARAEIAALAVADAKVLIFFATR